MKLIILTEGGKEYGLGHITRCISFYDELVSREYDVTIIVHGDDTVYTVTGNRNCILLNWLNNISLLANYLKNDLWLLLDSIQANQSDTDYLSANVDRFIVIDDYNRRSYNNTIIIDWTANIEKTNKHSHNDCNGNTLLLGLQYSVLRNAFLSKTSFCISPLKKILITMGGADIRHISIPLLEYLLKYYPDIEYQLIIGPGFDKEEQRIVKSNITYPENLDDYGMKEAMESSDLVISAGGQTLYEIASIGIPTIAIQVIDNQEEDIRGFSDLGLLIGVYLWNDPDLFYKVKNKITACSTINYRKEYNDKMLKVEIGKGLKKIIDIIEQN